MNYLRTYLVTLTTEVIGTKQQQALWDHWTMLDTCVPNIKAPALCNTEKLLIRFLPSR